MPPLSAGSPVAAGTLVAASVVGLVTYVVINQNVSADACGTSVSQANGANTAVVFHLGDSLTVGERDTGDLDKQYSATGIRLSGVDATSGISITAATAKLAGDTVAVQAADTAVVELGINDYTKSKVSLERSIDSLVTTLRSVNSSIKLYWVNTHSTRLNLKPVNEAIAARAPPDNYTVIDWDKEATGHPSKYHFDLETGVYLDTQGYRRLAAFIVDKVAASNGAQAAVSTTKRSTAGGQDPTNDPIKAASTVKTVTKGGTSTVSIDNQLAVSMHFASNIENPARDPQANGAGGLGWYQIQKFPIDWHPDISVAGTASPVESTNYMAPKFRDKLAQFNRTSASMWKTDPERAAETVAFRTERPASDYYVNRADAVGPAFKLALKQLAASGIPTDFGGKTGSGSSAFLVPTDQGGCQSPATGQTPVDPKSADKRTTVLAATNGAIGTMYAWAGGNTSGPTMPNLAPDFGVRGYDCSGLVLYVLGQPGALGAKFVNQHLIHLASDQYQKTKAFTTASSPNDLSHAQAGDLIFFTGSTGSQSEPGHVGIYIGGGKMISAPQSGERVQVADVAHSSFWKSAFVAITDPYAWAASLKKA